MTATPASARPMVRLAAGASGRRLSASTISPTRPAPTRSKHAEPGAVGDAVGPGVAVVDERRATERPRRHDPTRQHGRERQQRRPDTVATEPEPECDAEHRRGDARSRGGQEHRDGRRVGEHRRARDGDARSGRGRQLKCKDEQHVGRERERVPVADRVTEPRGSTTVGEERRDRLAGERPDDRRPESRDERSHCPAAGARTARAEQEPDDEEGREDERPVELVPRLVRDDRPRDREPRPGRGREQDAEQYRPSARLRRAPGERQGAPSARDQQRGERRPDRVACEERGQQQHGRDRHRHSGPPHRAPSYHAPRKAPRQYPGSLTKRLPSVHPGINAVRETLQDCPHHAGAAHTNHPTLVSRHPPPAVQAHRSRSPRAGRVRLAAHRHRAGSQRRSALRPPGGRRLVAGRPYRRHLRGSLLRRRDREPPSRRARLLERAGGHHARAPGQAARRACPARTGRSDPGRRRRPGGNAATPAPTAATAGRDPARERSPRRARKSRLRSARARARCPSRC